MIGSGLEGADLESRVASWAASGISGDAAAVRAVIEAMATGWRRPMWLVVGRRSHWKITQPTYQQMPEQSGGGCSVI